MARYRDMLSQFEIMDGEYVRSDIVKEILDSIESEVNDALTESKELCIKEAVHILEELSKDIY